MDALIKIMFIIALFIANYNVLKALFNIRDQAAAEIAAMLLGGINVLTCSAMLALFHPNMDILLTIVCGFVTGFAVFVASCKLVVKYN